MKPSQLDFQVWSALRAPAWARSALKNPPRVTPALHAAINYRGGVTSPFSNVRERGIMEKSSALSVLRMVRRRNKDVYLYMCGASVEYAHLQPARAATYRRWLCAIERRRFDGGRGHAAFLIDQPDGEHP